jgi:tetratricopeptide (TPR) repeat protein
MYRSLLLCGVFVLTQFLALANDYQKAWEALQRNDRKQAYQYLEKAFKDPRTAADAYITAILLQQFEGQTVGTSRFRELVMDKVEDASPYLFALWFNKAVLGTYGRKTVASQLEVLEEVLKRNAVNSSVKAAARYVNAWHYLGSNQFDKARAEWSKIGAIAEWQLAGPFENLSGSGFYKSHGPLEHPEATAAFKSSMNAMVKWFKPSYLSQEGWVFLHSHFQVNTGITYAQSFVYAPTDMKVVLHAGINGSIKVWVNDGLVISKAAERVTELDTYQAYVQLKKGYNRVLVQTGFTDNARSNFIVRFTTPDGQLIEGLKTSSDLQAYTKQPGSTAEHELKHFAEAFFETKVKSEPDNLINYILLAETYLRNQKTFEARKLISEALNKHPDNSLLRYEYITCLYKEGNRTLLSQEIERLKTTDTSSYVVHKMKIEQALDEENYEEASLIYERMKNRYQENEDDLQDWIKILRAQQKTDEAIKTIQSCFEKYPDNPDFLDMMVDIQKNSYKNPAEAIKIYEKHLKDNFNFPMLKSLAQEYIDLGQKEEGIKVLTRLQQMFPYDAELATDIVIYYYQQQDYKMALDYCDKVLKLAPYVATYWNNKAVIQEQAGNAESAIATYKDALTFNPKLYETRKKIRTLKGEPDLYKLFPETDPYELIKKSNADQKPKDFDYSYLLDEKLAIMYAEGTVEEFLTMVIKIHSEKGIDKWKESYIPYNEYTQTLLIQKAEIVKKNGSKLQAETSSNNLVFTALEAGDALVIKYRLQNYPSGRLGKEFWDRHTFNSFSPSGIIRYCLLVDRKIPYVHQMRNGTLKPVVKEEGDYTLYTWEVLNPVPAKDEPYMPTLTDIGTTLHLSTIKTWNDIAQWYSDISFMRLDDEYELKDVYNEIFGNAGKQSDMEKARAIYNYIQTNIRYSSVSFRQGAFVPQRPSVTINTRLGDCKDLSTLFVSLASMAGLKANLVLVDTKDNGTHEMLLPGVEFNHCIVLLHAREKSLYLELTDNNLPFGSLPANLPGAASLVIPRHEETGLVSNLTALPATGRTKDKTKRVVAASIDGDDLRVKVEVQKSGALTSGIRSSYVNLSEDKMREEMEKEVATQYKNPVKVTNVQFSGIDDLVDSVKYTYDCTIKNEVAEIGEMKMFKIPFGDLVATIDHFSLDQRQFPLEYWQYENTDEYETVLTIQIPAGKKVVELPKSETFRYSKNNYSLQYKVTGDKLVVTRRAQLFREDVLPADYAAFKEFMGKIVKAESKYVAFK